jgi:hypothetical protein
MTDNGSNGFKSFGVCNQCYFNNFYLDIRKSNCKSTFIMTILLNFLYAGSAAFLSASRIMCRQYLKIGHVFLPHPSRFITNYHQTISISVLDPLLIQTWFCRTLYKQLQNAAFETN